MGDCGGRAVFACLLALFHLFRFYRATLYVSAVFALLWPSVCPSVRHVGGLYPHR